MYRNGKFLSSISNFFPLINPIFTCVDPVPYLVYGSGSTKVLNTDPIWIRIHHCQKEENADIRYVCLFIGWLASELLSRLQKTTPTCWHRSQIFASTDFLHLNKTKQENLWMRAKIEIAVMTRVADPYHFLCIRIRQFIWRSSDFKIVIHSFGRIPINIPGSSLFSLVNSLQLTCAQDFLKH